MRILGIDPGTNVLGYAVIEEIEKKPLILFSGKLNLAKLENPYVKLETIYKKIVFLCVEYKPKVMSIEAPFFGVNIQSMLKLGRAQGVAIAAAISQSLEVIEYTPRKIKQSITGNGNASKEQVAQMLKSIVNMEIMPDTFDETDAIAIALCHFYNQKTTISKNSYSNWDDFIKQNPNKIKK